MIAYNKEALKKRLILQKVEEWFAKKLLTKEQYKRASYQYNSGLYTPSIFIKIGLYLLTSFGMTTGFGIVSLLFVVDRAQYYQVFFAIYGFVCVGALEFLIRSTKHYKSGMPQAFLYTALGFLMPVMFKIFGGTLEGTNTILKIALVYLPLLIAATIRYNDRGVAFALMACLFTVYFLLIMKIGDMAKLIMPFAFMLLSIAIYLWTIRAKAKEEFLLWDDCLSVFETVVLLVFYAAGNYYVIRESSVQFFDMHLNKGEDIPLAIVFYLFTALVPLVYVYFGLKKKNKTLLWIGVLTIVLAVLTFKYYYGLHHPEYTLTIAGIIAIAIAYFSINYLKTPKYGITFEQGYEDETFLSSNAEALIIAQSFTQASHQKTTDFGGGSSGGAGATGEW